ncbi:hypothetical protein BV898_04895 [Hypsibius exemplaris]|uniref:Transmembrane protein n=1 Tax=Hypsibius exemplaris TaxID=2072580 RepID=A0A1W0X120_HYPEX|nr:hypothetical protein BV898_04895 [Hypsibius exemplaris]
MAQSTLHEEDEEEELRNAELIPLTTSSHNNMIIPPIVIIPSINESIDDEGSRRPSISQSMKLPLHQAALRNGSSVNNIAKAVARNGEAKPTRRLSFHGSVGVMSLASAGGKNRLSGSKLALNRTSKLLEVPFAVPPGAAPNHPDAVRGEKLEKIKHIEQRTSFDLPAHIRIIAIFCWIGWVTGTVEVLIQMIVYLHNSLHWRWSVGFWSGSVFITHSAVGYVSIWKRKLKVKVRTVITKIYLAFCGLLVASCVAEMACAVFTYNHASELINSTMEYDEAAYRVSAMEVSIFNSLLAGCGLLGILIAIFSTAVTLQRLNIEMKMTIAQSFNNLVSRRNSAMPSSIYSTHSIAEKSSRSKVDHRDDAEA